jgi:hypothetical protein
MRGNLNFASQKSMEHPVAVICNKGENGLFVSRFFFQLDVVGSYFFSFL